MTELIKKMSDIKNQTTKLKFPLNIQCFAEDPSEPNPTDPGKNDPPGSQDPSSPEQKSFTQKDIDDAVSAARTKWENEQKEQQTEAQKLAKMNEEDRAKYQAKKKEKDLAEREAALNRRELEATAKETLISKGYPTELAAVLDYKDADACNKSIDTITKAFEKAVNTKVEERIRGGKPFKKADNSGEAESDAQFIYNRMMGK